jgi:hypothetical protein
MSSAYSVGFLFDFSFFPDVSCDMLFRNVCWLSKDHTALCPKHRTVPTVPEYVSDRRALQQWLKETKDR